MNIHGGVGCNLNLVIFTTHDNRCLQNFMRCYSQVNATMAYWCLFGIGYGNDDGNKLSPSPMLTILIPMKLSAKSEIITVQNAASRINIWRQGLFSLTMKFHDRAVLACKTTHGDLVLCSVLWDFHNRVFTENFTNISIGVNAVSFRLEQNIVWHTTGAMS